MVKPFILHKFIENWCILFSIMSLDRSLPCSVEVGPFSHLLPFVFDAQDCTRHGLKKRMASSLVQVFPWEIVGRSGALNLKAIRRRSVML